MRLSTVLFLSFFGLYASAQFSLESGFRRSIDQNKNFFNDGVLYASLGYSIEQWRVEGLFGAYGNTEWNPARIYGVGLSYSLNPWEGKYLQRLYIDPSVLFAKHVQRYDNRNWGERDYYLTHIGVNLRYRVLSDFDLILRMAMGYGIETWPGTFDRVNRNGVIVTAFIPATFGVRYRFFNRE